MTVKEHYDNHLSEFYSWIIGDFEKGKNTFKDFCIENGIKPFDTRSAIDLGAGNGIQSIALGEIGFNVKAVDFNDTLLSELESKVRGLPIELVNDNIININTLANSPVDLIICCGDTISHLDSFEQLDNLIEDCYGLLQTEGKLVLTFRDYSVALTDTQRFIPVKSDDKRILTCIIEYSDKKINVTDLLHEKINGTWIQKVSCYDKLRVQTDYVINKARAIGFSVNENTNINRMVYLILQK